MKCPSCEQEIDEIHIRADDITIYGSLSLDEN